MHERVEAVYFVFLCQLGVDFWIFVEQVFRQFDFYLFSIKCGQCSCTGFRQLWESIDVVVEIGWITVRRQLLKGQQNLVCFNCLWGVPTEELWLTCGARLLLSSWRNTRGAVGNLPLKSSHHVRAIADLLWTSCHHMGILFYLWAV